MENLFGKLTNVISSYSNVILMGHTHPDLDAFGSCLGMSVILNSMKMDNYIFIDRNNPEHDSTIKQSIPLVPNFNYIDETNYKKIIDDNSLLIILDTHLQERLEYPKILDEIKNVIVIDHHIKRPTYIKDTELFYIDSTLSSVVELVVNYAKYLEVDIPPIVSTIMLTGMEIDTNGFNIKITEKAFEAAALLVGYGADSVLKLNLLKETKKDFLRKADFIKSSYIFKKKYAICLLPLSISSQSELAEISDSLLGLEDIEASFTIGQLDSKTVGISARSLGNVDVCEIMQQLGGGGHMTIAACQVENTTMKALEKKLKSYLD